MKPQLDKVINTDADIEEYLNTMNIDQLEKKLTFACEDILNLQEELADAIAFRSSITNVLAKKRGLYK